MTRGTAGAILGAMLSLIMVLTAALIQLSAPPDRHRPMAAATFAPNATPLVMP